MKNKEYKFKNRSMKNLFFKLKITNGKNINCQKEFNKIINW